MGPAPLRVCREKLIMLAAVPLLLGAPAAIRAQGQSTGPEALAQRARTIVDSVMRGALGHHLVPGGVVVVVRGGSAIVQSGYGEADLSAHRAVDPARTLFGISSISKVFTAAAALRLSEQHGARILDSSVEELLAERDRHVRLRYPVTLANLLTHTGGFDELTIGVSARSATDLIPLERYLDEQLPRQVRRPGEVSSYSNHGYALVGDLIEAVADTPFATYIDRELFGPLGMGHSSFAQPLADSLEALRAIAYDYYRGRYRTIPRIYFNDAPASAAFTTGEDMAVWMRFMLGQGQRSSADSAGARHSQSIPELLALRHFGNDAALPGLTFGMSEKWLRGTRVLEQGGDWQDYSSDLLLAPELGVGLFAAFNAEAGHDLAQEIWDALWTLWGTPDSLAATPILAPPADPRLQPSYTGTFRFNRYSRFTIARLGILTGDVPQVTLSTKDGVLAWNGTPLVPVDARHWRRGPGGGLVALRIAESGAAPQLFTEADPYDAFEPVKWWDQTPLQLGVVILVVIVAVVRLTSAVLGRRTRRPASGFLLCLDAVTLVVVLGLVGVLVTSDPWEFQYGVPRSVEIVLMLPWVLMLITIAAIAETTARVARTRSLRVTWPALARLALQLLFTGFLAHWNLIAGVH